MKTLLVTLGLAVLTALQGAWAEQQIIAVKVDEAPVVDGSADDVAWAHAEPITTIDAVGNIEMTVAAVYTDEQLFVLVRFPDETQSRSHKSMLWSPELGAYQTGPKREDTLVLKWNMEPEPQDLSVSSETPYRADVWYWKSARTDHAGYADDKMHVYEVTKSPHARKVFSKTGRSFYLTRPGDEGAAAYRAVAYGEYMGEEVSKYAFQVPQGSRADVRAKGVWRDNLWTVEFARDLETGNFDDVRFDLEGAYVFGISRYEIAGRRQDHNAEQPNHGAGEISEPLVLLYR